MSHPDKPNALFLCGGRGTRLRDLTGTDTPKSLFRVGGQPLIKYSTDILDRSRIETAVFATDYMADTVEQWVGEQGLGYNHTIFSRQSSPGVVAAVSEGLTHVPDSIVATCNTDEVRIFDYEKLLHFHRSHRGLATMVTTHATNLHRHREILRDDEGRIRNTVLKQPPTDRIALVNTGLLVLNPGVIEYFDAHYNPDWSGIIDPLVATGRLYAYVEAGIPYFNVGTPEEYHEAEAFMRARQTA